MKPSRTQQAYDALRGMILDWRLPPGTVLSEHQLAVQLSISRTPIREAILILGREGLVRDVPGESAVVAELSTREVVESYQMRLALESYAARLAAENPRMRDLLTGVYAEMQQADELLERGEIDAYHRLAERTDSLIAAAAENRFMSEALQVLRGQVSRIRRIADVELSRLRESVQEHADLLEAILAGEGERAEQASRSHLTASLNYVLRELARRHEGYSSVAGVVGQPGNDQARSSPGDQ